MAGNTGESIENTVSNFFDRGRSDELNNAISDLYYVAEKDPTTKPLLSKYKIDKDSFKDLYWFLIRHNFARHRKGHFIPASTLVFGDTLEYILKVKSNSDLSIEDAKYRIIEYFDNNETGEIELEVENNTYSQLNKTELISKARELMFPLKVLSDNLEVRLEVEHPDIVKLPHWESFHNLYIIAASAILAIQLHNEVVESDRTEVELSMRDELSKEIYRFKESYASCTDFIKENIANAPKNDRYERIFSSASTWVYILMADKNNFKDSEKIDIAVIAAKIADSYKSSTIGYWNDIE